MKATRGAIAAAAAELAYSLGTLAWMAAGRVRGTGVDPLRLPAALFAANAPIPFALATAAAWLLAAVCVFKIASPLLAKRIPVLAAPDRVGSLVLDAIASAAALVLAGLHVTARAGGAAYFQHLPPLDYAEAAASLALNAWSLARLVACGTRRDPTYREYLEFRRQSDGTGGAARGILRGGIQRKLILSFMGLILAVIVVLTAVLMGGFRSTILQTIIDKGSSLTDRAASVIKAGLGDDIAIADYFAIESRKNSDTAFPFKSLSFYLRRPGTDSYAAAHSTEPALRGAVLPVPGAAAAHGSHSYNEAKRTFEFVAPVTLSNMLVGYVLADYDRDLIYEPYFRTQVRVALVASVFVYLSVFAIYVFGTRIVFPILFLRMSVNRISGTLAGMIRGRVRVSADLLRYEDKVPTRDEIKTLSLEIGNMTTVIRGIIPYISTSTLKHAERKTPLSQARHLAFLFTDIRGFTTLCEGLSPQEVVQVLNHYLDLQAGIIVQHHGDIDKFVADAVMGVFDGPTREINACRAAMAIRTAMARDRELKEPEKRNLISIGIGINTGPVVFGSVGAKDRMDFTSIGDTVNLAARLEGANKEYGSKSLVSQAVYEKVKQAFLCREIDLLKVVGKSRPVRIYEILQERARAAAKLVTLAESFEEGLACYRQRKWEAAAKIFSALADRLHDVPSSVFLRRIERFRADPPPRGWDGVYALSVK